MRAAALLCALALLAGPALAQDAAAMPGLEVSGRVARPGRLTLAALQALPPVTVTLTQGTEHGPVTGAFTGALLWTVLGNAGMVDEPGKRTFLRHTVLVQGRDGYAVALAVGELDPQFEGKQVLLAWMQDGKKLPGLKLVVPGDARAGRGVRDVVAVEVR